MMRDCTEELCEITALGADWSASGSRPMTRDAKRPTSKLFARWPCLEFDDCGAKADTLADESEPLASVLDSR